MVITHGVYVDSRNRFYFVDENNDLIVLNSKNKIKEFSLWEYAI